MTVKMKVKIGKITFDNPVTVASGTFGYGDEFAGLCDMKRIGALVTKTVTRKPWEGNIPPRIAETPSGMLNAIGLENPGIDAFLREKSSFLKKIKIPVIVSIGGKTVDEFAYLAKRLDRVDWVKGIEVNISCPNMGSWRKKRLFSQDGKAASGAVDAVRRSTKKAVITKLSPNVTDISAIACVAQSAGSDAVSMVNTFFAMEVDTERRMPVLGNVTGGLSGPAIRPIALRMVWDVYNNIDIPIIGMGGIGSARDAAAFMLCGASAVAVGTCNFVEPDLPVKIVSGLTDYLNNHKVKDVNDITGKLRLP